jgi:hypothetical protein
MILFGKDKQQKELEKQQKELAKQQKEQQKELEKQQKIDENTDLTQLSPIPIAEDEQALYRYNITKGTLRTKVIASYFVTNYRIVTMFGVQNNPQIPLENISDVVAVDTHREYEGGYRGMSTSSKGLRYTVGGQRGKSTSYGNIIISSPIAVDQTWYNIRDYQSVIRLIKSLRKTRKEQLGIE